MNEVENRKHKKELSPKEYNRFIDQVDITDIRVVSAKTDVFDYSYYPSAADVKWETVASYEKEAEGFNVKHQYNLIIVDKETKKRKAKISVTFHVVYSSKLHISDEIFKIFEKRNLPLNTWSYFREFVHNMTMRVGWPPFVAPKYVAS